MNKRETVQEIAKHAGSAHLSHVANQALRGEVSLDRALHETAKCAQTRYTKSIAEKAIDSKQ